MKFCQICYQAGKNFIVFGKHTTRNEKGQTTCNYLKRITCRLCDKTGHNASWCVAYNSHVMKEKETVLHISSTTMVLYNVGIAYALQREAYPIEAPVQKRSLKKYMFHIQKLEKKISKNINITIYKKKTIILPSPLRQSVTAVCM